MAKKKRTTKSNAEKFQGWLEESGLKEEFKDVAAEVLKEALHTVRDSLRGQPALSWVSEPGEEPGPTSTPGGQPADPYAILGVREDCSDEVLQAAFRARAKKTHPDIATGSDAEFRNVKAAYEFIKEERGI